MVAGSTNPPLTRDVLASFLPNPRAVKAFENLATAVDEIVSAGGADAIQLEAIFAMVQANAVADALAELSETLGREPGQPFDASALEALSAGSALAPAPFDPASLAARLSGLEMLPAALPPPPSGDILLSRYVATGTGGSQTISSIPGVYSLLRLKVTGRCDQAVTAANLDLQFNGDTGANYDWQFLTGSDTAASINSQLAQTSLFIGGIPGTSASANTPLTSIAEIFRYADTVFEKTVTGTSWERRGTANTDVKTRTLGGDWRSTSAITSLTVSIASGNFVAGTTIELWATP